LIGRNLHGLLKNEHAIKVRFESVAQGLLDHSNSTLPRSPRPSDLGSFLFLLPLDQPMSQRMFLGNKIASIRGPAHPFKDIP
jgi:hypothetical protein